MVRIKPFRGNTSPKNYAAEVASRPYDVLNSVEAKAEATERSLLHIIKPEIDFNPIADEHDPKPSTRRPWRISACGANAAGSCRIPRSTTMSMRRRWMGRTQYGLAMCCHFEDYLWGRSRNTN